MELCVGCGYVLPADIDAIIKKGERDTADLNQKMTQFTENAMKFTMDGGLAYDFKDEDEGGTDIGDLKAIMGESLTCNHPCHAILPSWKLAYCLLCLPCLATVAQPQAK